MSRLSLCIAIPVVSAFNSTMLFFNNSTRVVAKGLFAIRNSLRSRGTSQSSMPIQRFKYICSTTPLIKTHMLINYFEICKTYIEFIRVSSDITSAFNFASLYVFYAAFESLETRAVTPNAVDAIFLYRWVSVNITPISSPLVSTRRFRSLIIFSDRSVTFYMAVVMRHLITKSCFPALYLCYVAESYVSVFADGVVLFQLLCTNILHKYYETNVLIFFRGTFVNPYASVPRMDLLSRAVN